MNRLFFALDIQKQDKKAIVQWSKQQLGTILQNSKPVTENNLHITLAFLGNVSIEQQLFFIQLCNNKFLPSNSASNTIFKLSLNQIALFKKPKVLYLGFNQFPIYLLGLAELLSKRAKEKEIFQEARPYCPHVSIARKVNELITNRKVNIAIDIKSFSLYRSESTASGVIYTPINTWSLVQK
jgi:2'-5' RNA ligase